MNKKIYFLVLFVFIVLAALPLKALYWGTMEEYKDSYEYFALSKIVNNAPISYYLKFLYSNKPELMDNNKTDEETMQKKLQQGLKLKKEMTDLNDITISAFNTWFKDTKAMIEKDGRQEEFKDIMPILSNPIRLKRIYQEDAADITITFTEPDTVHELCADDDAYGCFAFIKKSLILANPYIETPESLEQRRSFSLAVAIHEIGHYFGLTDQYADFEDSSLVHSYHRIGKKDSIMAASKTHHLACDDVDGLINIIDLTLSMANKGRFSTRAKNGWASFCNGKKDGKGKPFEDVFYKKAKVSNKQNYVKGACVYKYTKEGDVNKSFCIDPFNFYNKELTFNQDGLIIKSVDKENSIEYNFIYNRIGENIIPVIVKFLDNNGKDFRLAYEMEDLQDGEYTWANPNIFPEHINMVMNNNICSVEEEKDFTNEYNLQLFKSVFDGKNNPISYSYEVLADNNAKRKINRIIPFKITLNKDSSSCVFTYTYEEKEVFKLNLSKQGNTQLVWENKIELDNIARNFNISREELLKEVNNMCKNYIPLSVKEGHKSRCKYFRNLEY